MSSLSRRRRTVDIWPGFVDALASLLMVFVFVFLIFMLSQYFLTHTLAGRNEALADLSVRINELARTLSLERKKTEQLREEIASLTASLATTEEERDAARGRADRLAQQLAGARDDLAAQGERVADLEDQRAALADQMRGLQKDLEAQRQATAGARERAEEAEELAARRQERMREMGRDLVEKDQALAEKDRALAEQRRLTRAERDQVGRLNQQITALRRQIQRLNSALEASEAQVAEQKIRIEDLGQRLNLALARKVEELKRYRSEFFGRLREVLGDNPDIRIVGDRFLFQSELLFATASAEVGPNGRQRLRSLARTLKEVSGEIPQDLDWVLRVDGHTDRRPIDTAQFPSNWELSTARALSIVHFLIDQGIPPDRLAAAGFGPYQPLDPADTPQAYAKNRRIEIKLTRP